MRFITDDHERCAAWAGIILGGQFHQPFTAIGAEKDGYLIAVAIFNNYNGFDLELTTAGRFTREMWRRVLDYIWQPPRSCTRITMRTRASNAKVCQLALHFGALREGRLRKYYGDEDAIIFGLLREDCLYVEHF